MARRGNLIIVSAPSGTGKTTVVQKLVATVPAMVISRSYTSRAPRPGEVDGVDYNFVDQARFAEMAEAGAPISVIAVRWLSRPSNAHLEAARFLNEAACCRLVRLRRPTWPRWCDRRAADASGGATTG